MLATTIIGILLFTSLLGFALWGVAQFGNRVFRDTRYRRRALLWAGLIYVVGAVLGLMEVAVGKQPLQTLAALPLVALIAWFFIRAALKTNVPD